MLACVSTCWLAACVSCSLIVDVEGVRRDRRPADDGAAGDPGPVCDTAWCEVQTSDVAGLYLNDVWAASATDAWIVGGDSTLLHWDGSRWTPRLEGLPVGESYGFNKVVGFATDDVWVVGDSSVVLQWTGASWETRGAGIASDSTLRAIWGTSASNLWTGGDNGSFYHWTDTGSWASVDTHAADAYQAIWGPSADLFWVAGWGGAVLKVEGGVFSPETIDPAPTGVIEALWGSAENDVWLGGTTDTLYHRDASLLWSAIPPLISGESSDWAAIWGRPPDGVWIGGPRIMHYNGLWAEEWLSPKDGIAAIHGAEEVIWAVGYGRILRRSLLAH